MAHGWAGTVEEFLAQPMPDIEGRLAENHRLAYVDSASRQQQAAWRSQLQWLYAGFLNVPEANDWGLVLEYELPFEGGRRPDVVVLAREAVVVLEFKEAITATRAHIDQVVAYARDLADYQSACHGRRVSPVLVLPRAGERDETWEGVPIIGPSFLPRTLRSLSGDRAQMSVGTFLDGEYAPLPTLVEAARTIFRDEPLPAIKRAESNRIPQLLVWLHDLAARALADGTRHLVLITGVPGSGKTLVGLQFVHESGEPGKASAWFLSGNGPLVQVLQDALRSTVFVRGMYAFVKQYGFEGKGRPSTSVWVFDEAQRAFDRDQTEVKQGFRKSEPDILIELGVRQLFGCVIIGLVGEGQEIYIGEEAGMGQWATAVREHGTGFQIHAPRHLQAAFAEFDPDVSDLLNLTLSLRTHRAEHSHEWVSHVLDGEPESARQLAAELAHDGFDLYVTEDLFLAKQYAVSRYAEEPTKRFGLVASSMAANLQELGIDNKTRYFRVAPWFNAPRNDPRSSCQLSAPATEFSCQGLELDLPILCWGDDLGWESEWKPYRARPKAKDSFRLRLNSYRVLMTRGRDGLVVWVPDNLRKGQQHAIRELLLSAGAQSLSAPMS
jgi:hypothetical protein